MAWRAWVAGAAGTLLSLPAGATPYWVTYEGIDFPENEGWIRTYGDGTFPPTDQPDRLLEDGELVISTARNPSLWEYYSRSLSDADDAECFVAEWRVRSQILAGSRDNGVVFARADPPGHVGFQITPGGLLVTTQGLTIPLDSSITHRFEFQSCDMSHFALWIDTTLAASGQFDSTSILHGYVAFGAGTQGASSISRWDYFRYGVVPEPNSGALIAACLVVLCATTNRRRLGK